MDQEPHRDAVGDGCKHEKKRGNHRQRVYPSCQICKDHLLRPDEPAVDQKSTLKPLRGCSDDRFVESPFTAISGIAMNDPSFGSFVDCGDDGTDLIWLGALRGMHLLL